ncbi:E3 ubiquitin-protein ligase CBL-C [Biomphalaria glabrata]|uniref:RING-type domain-containing protein n=1 Tax=Biomphalaria glabrata TaxID=6526 RepID=A0A2C9L9W9_BIOGL|nr:E3 ubiquitin-protein ligase CBL-C-like [Biomphalaria glabrata]KAI8779161.1 E3 ubiquitin-protein ligase CBL-C [Biomphalaria glabrata]
MLQSVLLGLIPAIVGLTAAFYIFNKIYSNQEEESFRSGPRSYPTFQTERTRTEAQNPQPRQRRNYRSDGDRHCRCAVCFEESRSVEIYPCGHRDICEKCILRIVGMDPRQCPFCRSSIKGYRVL